VVLNNYSGFGHHYVEIDPAVINNRSIFGANGVSIKSSSATQNIIFVYNITQGQFDGCIWRMALLDSEVVPVQKVGRNITGQRLQNMKDRMMISKYELSFFCLFSSIE
jgi:hypothetical protein